MKRTDIITVFPDATDEQVKTIMDIHGADINKVKGDLEDLKGQLSNAQKELEGLKAGSNEAALQAANEKAAALQNELDSLKHANSIRDIRDKVAGETKVPAALLTGETEEACASQAKAILEFAKNNQGYPIIKDGGEAAAGKAGRTESAWQQFASQISK